MPRRSRFARGRGGQRSDRDRVEALAGWAEQLRDTLSAGHGITETIEATARIAPEPIRAEVAQLALRLRRETPRAALQSFADVLDDPTADLIVAILALAIERSGRAASELLSELAITARERVEMRLRVDAERASTRAEARWVAGSSAFMMIALMVFGHHWLKPYSTATGQVVLVVVFGLYAARRDRVGATRPLSRRRTIPANRARMTALILAAGGAFGAGLIVIYLAFRPAQPSLADAVGRLHLPRIDASSAGWRDRLSRQWLTIDAQSKTGRELTAAGVGAELHAGRTIAGAAIGLIAGPFLAALLAAAGVGMPFVVPIWLALSGSVIGAAVPQVTLRRAAARRRRAFVTC